MHFPAQARTSTESLFGLFRTRLGITLFAASMLAATFSSPTRADQDGPLTSAGADVKQTSTGDTLLPSGTAHLGNTAQVRNSAEFREQQRSGEIQLLPGPAPMHEGKILPLLYSGELGPADQSITAGDLWSFFQRQGLEKVESIVLFLDVNKFDDPESITIKSIEFRIEPANPTLPVTTSALSESNLLVIPGYDSLSSLPEARLEIPLEFDFMQRFSADSRDRVFLKIAYDAPVGHAPNFFIAGQQNWITLPSFTLLLGFVAFWGILFFALARLTLKSTPATASDRQAS